MAKRVFKDEEARRRVLGGAQILYDAVKTTMGPRGRNVVIGKSYGHPTVTHDGVTVARSVDIPDVDDETLGYKVGAELIKQAAGKMNDVAGDGTTTVTVLTYHILSEADKLIAAGHNPMLLRKGLEAAAQDVITQLSGMAEDITGKKNRVAEVATISAGDAEIGKLIADIIDKVGKDSVVTVEEGQGLALESDIVEGFTFDKGFVSALMVTDTSRMEAIYDKPAIIVTDKKISSIQEILPVLEQLVQSGKKDLVLIAEDVEGDALANLILNKLKGVFNCVAVKAPSFGEGRKETLQDIAILTGATVISDDQANSFETSGAEIIGSARKVIVTKDETTIIEGAGSKAGLKARIEEITARADAAKVPYELENLEKRRAALAGKVAVIKVGGVTETEIEEKKFRVDDAVHAAKAALAEGIVPGGGITLVNLSDAIKAEGDSTETAGKGLLKAALLMPFCQLMENAGLDAADKLAKVKATKAGTGIDVNHPAKLADMKQIGVIDPVAVTRQAIQNAVSIAGTSMTMGALVVDIPTPEISAPSAGGMGMGGMMGM